LLRLLFALVQAVRRSTLEQQMRPAITAAAASRRAAGGAHAAYPSKRSVTFADISAPAF